MQGGAVLKAKDVWGYTSVLQAVAGDNNVALRVLTRQGARLDTSDFDKQGVLYLTSL
jgi:hypothetical protein